jgi:hypothetical protein
VQQKRALTGGDAVQFEKAVLPRNGKCRFFGLGFRGISVSKRGGLVADLVLGETAFPLWSGLAREGGVTVDDD